MLHARPTSDTRNGPKTAPRAPRRHARRARAQRQLRPTSRATASPRTPRPRYHAKVLIQTRQRMCGSLVDSKKRSRNALPKSDQRVSNEEALTARYKEATMRPPRAGWRGFEVPSVLRASCGLYGTGCAATRAPYWLPHFYTSHYSSMVNRNDPHYRTTGTLRVEYP